jgi:hypothetical protein
MQFDTAEYFDVSPPEAMDKVPEFLGYDPIGLCDVSSWYFVRGALGTMQDRGECTFRVLKGPPEDQRAIAEGPLPEGAIP